MIWLIHYGFVFRGSQYNDVVYNLKQFDIRSDKLFVYDFLSDINLEDIAFINRFVNQLVGLYDDGLGHLWVPSFSGLMLFDKQSKMYKIYTGVDGLADNEFNYMAGTQLHDGRILLGGINGVTLFEHHRPVFVESTKKKHHRYEGDIEKP